MFEALRIIWDNSGFAALTWQHCIMIIIACILIYLAGWRKFEPILLLPIAFGILLANLPLANLMLAPSFPDDTGGLLYYLHLGITKGIYPSLIFLGIGVITDFGPLIARPSALFLGAAAQLGIVVSFVLAVICGFTDAQSASIAMIGGTNGHIAVYLTSLLDPELIPPVAVTAYFYMSLIHLIQPPFMRLITTEKERNAEMPQLRHVSKLEKICFPILITILCVLLLPASAPLIGMLMLGNLLKESGLIKSLSDTSQSSLINIVTIFLGLTAGATANSENFLSPQTLMIIALGLIAFIFSTIGGVLFGKLMCLVTKGKINPLIGSAGVAYFPIAANISQTEGQKANPSNSLLMHAIGPNAAGVIGSIIVSGILFSLFGR